MASFDLKDAKRHGAVPAERPIQWVMWGEALIELLQGSDVNNLSTGFDEKQSGPILPTWLQSESKLLCAVYKWVEVQNNNFLRVQIDIFRNLKPSSQTPIDPKYSIVVQFNDLHIATGDRCQI